MKSEDQAEFKDYVVARKAAMLRTAYLVSGNWHWAEDIVSTAMVKLYTSWRRAREVEHLDAYVRQIVIRVYLDEQRRPWRREYPTEVLPEPTHAEGAVDGLTAHRTDLRRLLAQMPARQRAVLVLRFFDDLSVAQTAKALGCSETAAKTLTIRALNSIRLLLPADVTTRTEYEEAL
jgi:RNA polymerase sigma-70 factor (sigma-E family)